MEIADIRVFRPLLALGGIRAYYSVRGVGEDTAAPDNPYDGFSVCDYTGDEPSHVDDCRDRLRRALPPEVTKVFLPRQTHSVEVRRVDRNTDPASLSGVDALVTSDPAVCIGINTADCLPLVLADPGARIVGVAHAGWRGAVGGIVEKTVGAMIAAGADSGRIRAAVGPHICPECFEIGEEVAGRFSAASIVRRADMVRPHADLYAEVRSRLSAAGVPAGSIEPFDSSMCTRCHPGMFFSARASGVASGRVLTFAYLDGV